MSWAMLCRTYALLCICTQAMLSQRTIAAAAAALIRQQLLEQQQM
jgi:hypothetical protein